MAAVEPLLVIIVHDHEVVAEGLRSWCARAVPPIDLLYAGPHPRALRTGVGTRAQVVILDLRLSQGRREFNGLRRLVDAGRRVVVYTQDSDKKIAPGCIRPRSGPGSPPRRSTSPRSP